MGLLVDGVWHDKWYDTRESGGRFIRSESQFRSGLSASYAGECDRYHLYAGYACPWAHRTLIMRSLKGLEDFISLSMVNAYMGSSGWTFEPGDGVIEDSVNDARFMYEVYQRNDPQYTGRVTIPVLWDKYERKIINNESSEIIRILNSAFDGFGAAKGDYYPAELRHEIDSVNEVVYERINNGVYRSGFATTQLAYEEAVYPLFDALDELEKIIAGRQWLVGDKMTEADVRLFTTLVRFSAIYFGHFKCNLKPLSDYPGLSDLVKRMAQHPKIEVTINLRHAKDHYYRSHLTVNPTGIVPVGPSSLV